MSKELEVRAVRFPLAEEYTKTLDEFIKKPIGDPKPRPDSIKRELQKLRNEVVLEQFEIKNWSRSQALRIISGMNYPEAKGYEDTIRDIAFTHLDYTPILSSMARLWMDKYSEESWRKIGKVIASNLSRIKDDIKKNTASEIKKKRYEWWELFHQKSPEQFLARKLARNKDVLEEFLTTWRLDELPKIYWASIPYLLKILSRFPDRCEYEINKLMGELRGKALQLVHKRALNAMIIQASQMKKHFRNQVYKFVVEKDVLGDPRWVGDKIEMASLAYSPPRWRDIDEEVWLAVRKWVIGDVIREAFKGEMDQDRRRFWLGLHDYGVIDDAIRIDLYHYKNLAVIIIRIDKILITEFTQIGNAATFWHKDKLKFAPDGWLDVKKIESMDSSNLKLLPREDNNVDNIWGALRAPHQAAWCSRFLDILKNSGVIEKT